MSFFNRHTIKVLLFLLLVGVGTSFAQRKKNQKTEDKLLQEAEFYFTEGEKYYILEDYAKALVLFQKSLEINDKNATVYYKLAQIEAQGDNPIKALEHIQEALNLEKDNKYFYILAADIYTQMNNFAKAAEVYETLVSRIEKTDQYLFELAAIYLYQNRLDDALSTYDRIEQAYGLSEEVIFQKQKIHLKSNNIEKALSEGEKLVALYEGEEAYVLKQVEILMANERLDDAATYLEKHVSKFSESPRSRLVLSELSRKKGNYEKAGENLKIAFSNEDLPADNKIKLLAEYRSELPQDQLKELGVDLAKTLIETHPDVADCYTIYGDILQAVGNSDGAKNQYIKSLELNEANFGVWQNVLQLMLGSNKIDSVILFSEKALTFFPNQSSLYYFNGASNLQKKNYEEAIASLEQGKRLSSANLGLLSVFNIELGTAYNGIKEYEKSDKAYEAALDFDPSNYMVLNNYSYYLSLRKEKLEKAEKMSSKAVKNNPENTAFIDTYAWVLYVQGKYKEAKKVMERVFEVEDGVSAIHYEHYGDILFKLGKIDEAVKQWQKAKGLNPNSELIDKKIANRKIYE